MPRDAETSAQHKRWVVSGEVPLLWQSWGDNEHIVYSAASGDTHLVNEVTAEVLRQLERSELDFADLALNVANSLGTELDQQTETSVARLLVYLDQIGLVESVP